MRLPTLCVYTPPNLILIDASVFRSLVVVRTGFEPVTAMGELILREALVYQGILSFVLCRGTSAPIPPPDQIVHTIKTVYPDRSLSQQAHLKGALPEFHQAIRRRKCVLFSSQDGTRTHNVVS